MAVKGLTREQIVYMVKLAEQAERYEDMVSFMERLVVGFDEELTVEERNLFSVACNKVIGSLLFDAGSSRMEEMMNVEGAQSEELYKSMLETETSRILKLLDSSSASLSSSSSSSSSKSKSKRCLMEISTAKNRIAQSLMEETETKLTREHCISLAKLAEKSKRYEDMATFMEKFAIIGSAAKEELTAEGRDLFYLAHENVIGSLLATWLILSLIEQKEESQNNEEHAWLVKQYRSKVVETELSELCSGILKLLDAHLVPSASTSESKVLYLKMKGDYHGYLSEFNVGTERKDAAEDSVLAYKAAKAIVLADFAPTHPIRLGFGLGDSMAKQAKGIITVHDASSEDKSKGIITVHDASSEDKYKVGNPVNQFSRDKPTLLTSDMQTNKFSREILGLIVRKLCHCSDFINFGAVCKFCKFVSLENMQELPLGQFPGIVVPGILPESETRRLFLWNNSSCCFEEVAALQIPHRYLCCGSAFGWVFLTDDDLNTRLSNPFSGAELKLPSLHALRDSVEDIGNSKYIVYKAIYSSNPSFSPLPFVLIILGEDSPRLAFCKPGDKKWTDLNSDGEAFFTDAIYHKGKFYTLRWDGEIVAYDIKCNGQADYSVCATTIAPPTPSDLYGVYHYLVEVKGVLVILSSELEVVIETEHLDVEPVLPADDEDVEPVLPADDEDDAENSDDSDESSSESSDDNSDPSDDETTESSSEQSDDDIDDDVMSHHQGVNRWEERITGFNMLKFDDVEQKWVKLEDLGEYSVFIGLNTSFSLCATNFPDCIPNQVYFGGSERFEMGIFQLSHQSMSRHVENYRNNGSVPVWIDHTLWSLKHL